MTAGSARGYHAAIAEISGVWMAGALGLLAGSPNLADFLQAGAPDAAAPSLNKLPVFGSGFTAAGGFSRLHSATLLRVWGSLAYRWRGAQKASAPQQLQRLQPGVALERPQRSLKPALFPKKPSRESLPVRHLPTTLLQAANALQAIF